jgi:hypothetical protein
LYICYLASIQFVDGNNTIAKFIICIETVQKDKPLTKAKDGKTGQIIHSGTDSADVIQRALDFMPTAGGVLSISDGCYLLESNNINNLTIQGNSCAGNVIFDA